MTRVRLRASRHQALAVVALLWTSGACAGQEPRVTRESRAGAGALHTRLPALMDSGGIPGVAVAVLRAGEVLSIRGAGQRSDQDSMPVDENTVFEAASLSKPVVAYLVLKLVEEGKLDLDRPLQAYAHLPELTDARAAAITTRMVLSHTTGLQNERIGGAPLLLAFDPGQRFRYSGEGFLLLQRVIEAITGESLLTLSKRQLLDPLGMTRSGFVWRAEWADNAAIGHGEFRSRREPTRPSTARAPSSFHTTAHDYARFVRALLRREGLHAATFEAMLSPGIDVAPNIAWGLGWALELRDGNPVAWHWGDNSNSGFTSFVLADLDRRDAVLYFANSRSGLSIVRPVLAAVGLGDSKAPAFMGYETHDAPSRIVRLAIEKATRERGIAAGLAVHDSLKIVFGAGAFQESLLNTLGYRFLSLNRPADAVGLFERNAQEYPQSSNVYDSLGEGLVALGKSQAAIMAYRRSYELDPRNERALREAERLRRISPEAER